MIPHNSEILFLYDAKLCNPNGDPDEENRPRMDYETGRNLVSDVRLKRYLRDYWLTFSSQDWEKLGYDVPQDIWVRREIQDGEQKTVTAKERIDNLARQYKPGKTAKDLARDQKFKDFLKNRLIDLRLFGAVMPIDKKGGSRGDTLIFTGPVQFTWGYSLNRVEILPSSTITSTFAGQDVGGKGEYGTMGKDWRVKYSFLAFWGVVSAARTRDTGMDERDLDLLDHSIFEALSLLSSTRSKIGQTPRFYMRVEYGDDHTLVGDFREVLKLKREEGLESIEDIKLDASGLVDRLKGVKDRIVRVKYRVHPAFSDGKSLVETLRSELGQERVEEVKSAESYG